MDGLGSEIADLGLRNRLNDVVSNASTLWQRGLIHHPDFTLHGIVHSQTVDRLIRGFSDHVPPPLSLNDKEKFILAASAYLHDLGMLFPLDSYIEGQVSEDSSLKGIGQGRCCEIVVERFCEQYGYGENACQFFQDLKERPLPQKIRAGEIVRQFHHLFSDHMIKRHWQELGLPRQAFPLVAVVSKGHRMVDLRTQDYNDTSWAGSTVRLGALAALLRVSDELDYSSERAPDILFELFIDDLIRDPRSLAHWIKHFCIRSVGPPEYASNAAGLVEPIVAVVVDIPSQDYRSIIDGPVEKSISQVSAPDVKEGLRSVGLCCPRVNLQINIDASTTYIPKLLQDRIGDLGIVDFLRQQMEDVVVEETPSLLAAGFVDDEIAKMVGYERRLYRVDYNCLNEEQTEVTWEVHIKSLQKLSHVRHFYESYDPLQSISTLDFQSLTPNHRMNATRRFTRADTYREIDVTIEPPLEEGEEASYRFSETYRGVFVHTERAIVERIAANRWPFADPVEGPGSTVLVPTEELQLSVFLPASLEMEELQFRVDMLYNVGTHVGEEKRLEQLNCLQTDDLNHRKYMRLVVPNPQLMLTYWLLWKPKQLQ